MSDHATDGSSHSVDPSRNQSTDDEATPGYSTNANEQFDNIGSQFSDPRHQYAQRGQTDRSNRGDVYEHRGYTERYDRPQRNPRQQQRQPNQDRSGASKHSDATKHSDASKNNDAPNINSASNVADAPNVSPNVSPPDEMQIANNIPQRIRKAMARATKTDDASHAEQVRIALDSPPWESERHIRQQRSAVRSIQPSLHCHLQPRDHESLRIYGVMHFHLSPATFNIKLAATPRASGLAGDRIN
ncbi:hypothetical protein MBLNU13_g09255t1 [Cladosporium sp. NU13]